MKINLASSLKIQQKLQITRHQFWKENHTQTVVNKPRDFKNMFQPITIQKQKPEFRLG